MKIVIAVSDFPKVTETFVTANALHYLKAGHDARVFHIKAFRHSELVHPNAGPVIERSFTFPWVAGPSFRALLWAFRTRPGACAGSLGTILRAFHREPRHLLASLAIVPKALALGHFATREGVDHIHAEFAGYPATAAWLASRVSGVPFSFSAHAHDIFLTQRLLPEKAKAAQFVRVISDFNKRFLEALPGFPKEKLKVLRCGVELHDSAPPPAPPGPNSGFRILFVGALLPRKGVEHLLRAVARLPERIDWHLDIIGDGSEGERLRRICADSGLTARTSFLGAQSAAQVRAAMQAAHVVVVPSIKGRGGRSEGIPVVLMEALAQARPVISSRLSGIPELVRDNQTGLLTEPGDEQALSAALVRVHDDYDEACALGRAGQAAVRQEYDIETNAAALLAMIERTS